MTDSAIAPAASQCLAMGVGGRVFRPARGPLISAIIRAPRGFSEP
jgi:hypothetical protein